MVTEETRSEGDDETWKYSQIDISICICVCICIAIVGRAPAD